MTSLLGIWCVMVNSGCGQDGHRSSSATSAAALSANAGSVLGFEHPTDWHVISGPAIPLTSSATHSQGTASLAVKARNYVALQSAAVSVSSAIPGPISYDLSLPAPASPWGATQLFIDCHSQSVFNQYLGQTDLTTQPTGKFVTMTYALPATLQTALKNGCRDLVFTVVLNVPSNSTGTYLVDNLQLAGPPIVTACQIITPPADAGAVASGIAFSTKLNRPDVGTFTLDWRLQPAGSTTASTTEVKLNGNPLIQASSQLGSGTTVSSIIYSPPFSGIGQISTSSDGQTMVITVDGRQTVPAPVGADPSTIHFVDGGPVPHLVVDGAIGDAVLALEGNVASSSSACAASLGVSATPAADGAALVNPRGPLPIGGPGFDPTSCQSCELGCNVTYLGFSAGAIGACFLGGPFGCAAAVAANVARQFTCITTCHNAGSACCPIACGDTGGYSQPSCCGMGTTCLKPGDFDHDSLCCPAGGTACGGQECCGTTEFCVQKTGPIGSGDPPAFCCGGAGETACGNVCCRNGARCIGPGVTGCCMPCGSNADCDSAEACVNGCCVPH